MYVRKYGILRYLASYHSDGKYEEISDRIRYLIMLKSNKPDIFSLSIQRSKLIQTMI